MDVLRYTAFTRDPAGGNPAGVVLDAAGADPGAMLALAAEVGFSETAFLFPLGDDDFDVRYFSPRAEVPFCGHATIASAVALAERRGPGQISLNTRSGLVKVSTQRDSTGLTATLTSVPPRVEALPREHQTALLDALGWSVADLDHALPPRVAYAGAWHPIVAVAQRERLSDLHYDFAALESFMAERGWTTVDLVWRATDTVFHSRNPFPPGGVVEDPATGAAAAAFGGYLRDLALVPLPTTITVLQGHDLGRPSELTVTIPEQPGSGISVTGHAVPLDARER